LISMRHFNTAGPDPERSKVPEDPSEEASEAKKKALSLLEFADRSEHELREKLREKGFSEVSVNIAVEYVRSFHYLDDRRFAENFIRSREGRKSVRELKMLLMQKGVSDEDISAALENSKPDERETVKKLYLKKYGRTHSDQPGMMEKALRYFAGKGYSYDVIRSGIEMALEEQEDNL